jgi:hypothetical protein
MSAVVSFVADVVSDTVEFVGDITEDVVEFTADAVETVAETASNVVEGALDDPLGTIVTVTTAIYAPYLLPAVEAGKVVANGGDIDDALKAAAIAYVAPQVAKGVSTEFANSAFANSLSDAAIQTGIESLPSAATAAVGRAAAGTLSGLAQGQDLGDALTRGLTSGAGSFVGNVAGSEADTGSAIGDRLIATGAGAATTAGLRGGSGSDAAESAISNALMNYGFNEAGKLLPSYSSLASSGATATDAGPSPTEELMMQMQENVVDTTQNQQDADNTQALIDALYPTSNQGTLDFLSSLEPLSEPPGAETSEPYDYFGISEPTPDIIQSPTADQPGDYPQFPGSITADQPEDFPQFPGSPTADQPGDYPQTMEEVRRFDDIFASPQATAELLGKEGDQPGDFPRQILENPDGTVTALEFDGTKRVFNLDGSVTKINPDGTSSTEVEAPSTTSTGQTPGINLGALANSLLSGGQTGKAGNWSAATLAGLAGAGALASQFGGADAGNQMNVGSQGFDWNQSSPWMPQNAVAYGQQFVNPTYAAQGGLMSIVPTVGDQANRLNSQSSNPVNMYAAGGRIMPVVKYASGGLSTLGSYSDGGRLLKGPGDGMSDNIPANISGKQPARLADGEFVIPADVVSHLGNGSTDAGAKVLYDMMSKVRRARTGKPQQGKQINPKKFTPR